MGNPPRQLAGLGALLSVQCWEALLALGRPHRYSRGDILMRAGEEGCAVVALTDGRVKICRYEPDGLEVPIAVRYAGEVLGEIAALGARPRTATVVAIEPCCTHIVLTGPFTRFVEKHALSSELMRHAMTRLQESEDHRAELIAFPSSQRLCRALLRHAMKDQIGRWIVDLNMSQEEFGRMVGASRNAVGLVLGRLRELDIVETSRRTIIIMDIEALRAHAVHPLGE